MPSSTIEGIREIQAQAQRSEAGQVRTALRPGLMGVYLSQALGQMADGPNFTLPCRILDMKYEPGDYCTLLYELGSQLAIGHIRWSATDSVPTASSHRIDQLGMEVYPFPIDPWLPGLPMATDPQAIAWALAQALPECRLGQSRVLRVRVAPQRYRPGKRFTLRLDIVLRDGETGMFTSRTFYGKLYHKAEKAASVFQEMQLLTESSPVREGRVLMASAAAFLPELSMVLQEPVAGTPLEDLLGRMEGNATRGDPRGWSATRRAAAALAAVHTAGLTSPRRRPIEDELRRFQKRATQVRAVDANQGTRMAELADALPAWLNCLDEWGAELSLIHGDCKPSQFLIGDDQVAILDFDHTGMADPANDVGTFLATLRQLALRQSLKARGDAEAASRAEWLLALEKHFLEEYCMASNRGQDFHLRATWYQAAGLMRKTLRAFGRSPFSPLPGAMVAEAWRCLAELPPPGKA